MKQLLLLIGCLQLQAAGLSVSLTPSLPAPAQVGQVVTWTAEAPSASAVWYRFRSARAGWDLQVVRDFSPANALDWTASESEGVYEIEVTARDNSTGETALASATYQVNPLVTSAIPVITPTVNPLVFLYSAPACGPLESMRVEMVSPEGVVQSTPSRSCHPPCHARSAGGDTPLRAIQCAPASSMNFYLAGLRPNTAYSIQHVISGTGPPGNRPVQRGPALTLVTPNATPVIPSQSVKQPSATPGGLVLHSSLFTVSYATDLSGNLVWYYPSLVTFLTQVEPGGLFVGLISPTYASPQAYDPSQEIFREFDLAGNTVRETNAARLNEQLAPMGKRIGALHHDARALPDGTVAVLASTEQMLTNVQGSGTVDVIGDMILVLDRNLQIKWVWDAFDHLDTHRLATLNEVCPTPGGGCPPLYLAKKANDWVHGNAIQFLADGSLLYSSRHQDWVYKIDYANGHGSGDVVWKMGPGGDFQIQSSDPSPWFSHQHDPEFAPGGNSILTVFDDGNLRAAHDSKAHSRGQALMVDEQNRVVTLAVNTDLGGFSFALGSSQQLAGGGYAFGAGWYVPANDSQVVEVDPSGNTAFSISVSRPEYRTYRLNDLYTP